MVFQNIVKTTWEGDVKKIHMGRDKCQECIIWMVGNGDKISFWMDSWLQRGALKNQLPQIFAIARHKDITIYESVRDIGGRKGMACGGDEKLQLLGN